LPLAARGGLRSPEGERYCCSGCFVAHRLSRRGLEGRVDRLLARVVLSAFLAMGVMVFSLALYGPHLFETETTGAAHAVQGVFRLGALALSTPVLLLLGAPLADAVVSLRRFLSAEALILAGSASAWIVSVWNTFRGGGEVYYDTATMVLVLYSLGRWLEARAKERALEELRRIAPEREGPAAVVGASLADERAVALADVRAGDLVRVRPGEVVPVDGVVVSGRSFADTSALTGEASPRSLAPGDAACAGFRLTDGTLVVRTERAAGERLRDAVERLLREAVERRSRYVVLADRLAGALMPFVLALAAATAAWRWRIVGAERALLDALSVVLISCPCALGLATPLAFWSAIGAAWKRGVLVRGGDVLERLARARRVWLDKTGTLTSGELRLAGVDAEPGCERDDALRIAAALEVGSEHPIAHSLRKAWRDLGSELDLPQVEDFRALPGIGVEGTLAGRRFALRNAGEGDAANGETRVALECGADRVATLRLRAQSRPEAPAVLRELREMGYELRMLTGDDERAAGALARTLAIDVEARLTPVEKLERIRAAGPRTIFVGDGLNDAAALAAAGAGVSVAGSAGASLSAAEVNFLRPGLSELPGLLRLARSAVSVARLNLAWAFAYNALGLGFAATGRLSPIFAASAMVASSVVSVLNSSRLRGAARDVGPERADESGAGEARAAAASA
jgi:Cu2+-exporting ATPase